MTSKSIRKPIAIFGLNKAPSAWNFSFSAPKEVRYANSIGDVVSLLEFAEAQSAAGNYVAVMLSYEAAQAFDSVLKTHNSSTFPLAWAAVFTQPDRLHEIHHATAVSTTWEPLIGRLEYDSAVERIHDLIARGDTYQVNYTFPLVSDFPHDPVQTFAYLSAAQGAPYSALLDLGRQQILSFSPELFFERTGDRVRTRPMKGTVRRGRWSGEDRELANWLSNSAKDRAENVMIVDLIRNDLGKVSIPGSVKVSSLFALERFQTVWQMTSTVESVLQPNTSLVELLRALFPCGSITGAPKIRTMEIIKGLEGYPRGAYTGTIGLLRPGGDCIFNVAIRTVVVDSATRRATFGVGGGITIDSTAETEYQECLVKANFLNSPLESFDLFESILLVKGEFFLLKRHLKRLQSSAEYFGFEFPKSQINGTLEKLRSEHLNGSWKIRLALSASGAVTGQAHKVRIGGKKKLRIGVSEARVNSGNNLLFHKTTHRAFYISALKTRQDCDDVVFTNERGELTESTVANVVVRLEGKLLTPPVTAGLLAGTFRDQLIADGVIEERSINISDLRTVREFFLINSVRKWMPATMVEE